MTEITRRGASSLLLAALAAPAVLSRTSFAADAPRVRIQGSGNTLTNIPELYAHTFGLFEKNGISAENLPGIYNAGGILQAIVQGTAEIASTGGSAIIQAAQQGRRVKTIGIGMQGFEIKVSLTKPGLEKVAKLGVSATAPINDRVNALRGMRLAAPATGSSSDTLFRYSMKRLGMDANRDTVVQPMPDMPSVVAAARTGAVDGIIGLTATGLGRAEAEGTATRFISFEVEDPTLSIYPAIALVVSDEYLAKNGDTLRRVLTAYHQAKQAIRRGLTEDELAAVKKKFFPDMPDAAWTGGLKLTTPNLIGPITPSRAQFDALFVVHNATAEVPASVTYEQCFDSRIAEAVEKA